MLEGRPVANYWRCVLRRRHLSYEARLAFKPLPTTQSALADQPGKVESHTRFANGFTVEMKNGNLRSDDAKFVVGNELADPDV